MENFVDILKDIMKEFKEELLDEGSIFVSEADFQFCLAQKLAQKIGSDKIILEYPENNKYVDLLCKFNDYTYYLELKYKTDELKFLRYKQKINLKIQSAQNDNRYLLYKDIERLEGFIKDKDKAVGISLFVTNDKNYWKNTTPPSAKNFPLCNAKTNSKNYLCVKCPRKDNPVFCSDKNKLCYLDKNSDDKKRALVINNVYSCQWNDFGFIKINDNTKKNLEFRYLLIEVTK